MITARRFRPGQQVETVRPADISEAVARDGGVVWADVVDPGSDDLQLLAAELGLHPLALEDARKHGQRPKLERYPNHAFIVAYSADLAEVDMFVGRDWLVTVRGPNAGGQAWDCEQAAARFERVDGEAPSVGALLHAVLDALVDGYFERADGIEDRIEAIEDSVFAEELRTEHDIQRELFVVRRELLEFRRAAAPLRDVVAAVLRRELEWIQGDELFAFQDVFDHLLRVLDQIDVERELMGNAVEAHLAIISNRMNRVMKTMTSWGAILFGSGLIAGVYGMNFRHMPELDWYLGYPMALAMMASLTTALVLYFRRKDWL